MHISSVHDIRACLHDDNVKKQTFSTIDDVSGENTRKTRRNIISTAPVKVLLVDAHESINVNFFRYAIGFT